MSPCQADTGQMRPATRTHADHAPTARAGVDRCSQNQRRAVTTDAPSPPRRITTVTPAADFPITSHPLTSAASPPSAVTPAVIPSGMAVALLIESTWSRSIAPLPVPCGPAPSWPTPSGPSPDRSEDRDPRLNTGRSRPAWEHRQLSPSRASHMRIRSRLTTIRMGGGSDWLDLT